MGQHIRRIERHDGGFCRIETIAVDPVQPQVGDEHESAVAAELHAVLLGSGLLVGQRLALMLFGIEGTGQLAVRSDFVGGDCAGDVIHCHRHAAGGIDHNLIGIGAMGRYLVQEFQRAGVPVDGVGADRAILQPVDGIEILSVGRDPDMRGLRRLGHQAQRRHAAVGVMEAPSIDAFRRSVGIGAGIEEVIGGRCRQRHQQQRGQQGPAHHWASAVCLWPWRVRNASRSRNSSGDRRLS